MKLKIEELKKIPLRIINELKEVKEMEENNKQTLMKYRHYEADIKNKYENIERLIQNWNDQK